MKAKEFKDFDKSILEKCGIKVFKRNFPENSFFVNNKLIFVKK